MCETTVTVYVSEAGQERTVLKAAQNLFSDGQNIVAQDMMGQRKSIPGRLKEVDLPSGRAVVEPTAPLPDELQDVLSRAELFHGHLGPDLVIGLRMGMVGKRILGFEGHFDVEVEAFTGQETPVSCIVDGLQFGTGATLGKGNIEVSDMRDGKPGAQIVSDRDIVDLSVTETALETVNSGLQQETGETVAGQIAHMPEDRLFSISRAGE